MLLSSDTHQETFPRNTSPLPSHNNLRRLLLTLYHSTPFPPCTSHHPVSSSSRSPRVVPKLSPSTRAQTTQPQNSISPTKPTQLCTATRHASRSTASPSFKSMSATMQRNPIAKHRRPRPWNVAFLPPRCASIPLLFPHESIVC